jgi:hypothetical protein
VKAKKVKGGNEDGNKRERIECDGEDTETGEG